MHLVPSTTGQDEVATREKGADKVFAAALEPRGPDVHPALSRGRACAHRLRARCTWKGLCPSNPVGCHARGRGRAIPGRLSTLKLDWLWKFLSVLSAAAAAMGLLCWQLWRHRGDGASREEKELY